MPKGIPKNGLNKGWIKKGSTPWSKGLNIWRNKPHPKGMLGKKNTSESNLKRSVALKGVKKSIQARKNMSEAWKGEKCMFWKGGVYAFRDHLRDMFEYRQWRSDCFTRDNFTCICGTRGGKLHVHHIKPFAKIIEENNIKTLEQAQSCSELWNINNGQTLCETCHRALHKKMV